MSLWRLKRRVFFVMRLRVEIAAGGGPETQDKWRDVKFPLHSPNRRRTPAWISSGRIALAPVCNRRRHTERWLGAA
jgi:hypothetical protein